MGHDIVLENCGAQRVEMNPKERAVGDVVAREDAGAAHADGHRDVPAGDVVIIEQRGAAKIYPYRLALA